MQKRVEAGGGGVGEAGERVAKKANEGAKRDGDADPAGEVVGVYKAELSEALGAEDILEEGGDRGSEGAVEGDKVQPDKSDRPEDQVEAEGGER